MPRIIPLQMKSHLESGRTTTCYLLRIAPVTPGYAPYGAAMLDKSVTYDDGAGPLLYSAIIGMRLSTISTSSDLGVNNAESEGLLPEYDFPISEADIVAGVYDFAKFDLYLVNYKDLSIGSHVLMQSGTLGRVSVLNNGLSFVEELRGLTDQLKQSLCEKDSLSCREIFGSGAIGSGAAIESETPCGFDVSSLLVAGTVSAVGAENTVTFTVGGFSGAADSLALGVLKFTTGANAGRTYEIEGNTPTGIITLAFPASFPVQIGDACTYRPGCNKQARDALNGCKRWWGAQWPNHFRGEPDIPIGDAGSIETPGASSSPGQGAPTHEAIE